MNRILYSQNENILDDDHFVIDGVLYNNNVSNQSIDAFNLIKSTENWKIFYATDDLTIRREGAYFNIKSHYVNVDSSDRNIFYVYYIKSKDIKEVFKILESDSAIIKKQLNFEAEILLREINKIGNKLKRIFTVKD